MYAHGMPRRKFLISLDVCSGKEVSRHCSKQAFFIKIMTADDKLVDRPTCQQN
jgi:hypothetical protein